MKRVLILFIGGFFLGGVLSVGTVMGYVAYRLKHWTVPERVVMPVAGPRPVPKRPDGPLSGLIVYVSAGHGWLLHRRNHDGEPISWGRQRSPKFGMVEDDWTADFTTDYLAPALEQAGATVIALRERDRNPEELVVDDMEENFAAYGLTELELDDRAHGGRSARLAPGGSANWKITVPHDGQWFVYTRWTASADLDDNAIFTVSAGESVREIVVDQKTHGGHWWPLGDDCLRAGTVVDVTLTGSGLLPLSADAVRLGGGTFRVVLPWSLKVKDQPYADVSMTHQLERIGAPEWIGEYECGNHVSDMRLRPHWASWASETDREAVYVSIHTNASPRGPAKGLTSFYGVDSSPPTPADPESIRLATLLEKGVYNAVHKNDKGYITRGTLSGDYSEVSPVHNELPSVLLEMGFHDNREDARRMQTELFQRDAADGIRNGLVKWRETREPSLRKPTTSEDGRGPLWRYAE